MGHGKAVLVLGDSIATGFGALDDESFAYLIAKEFRCRVDVATKPFAGIAAVPELLAQFKGFWYRGIVLSAGGNDSIPPILNGSFGGSSQMIEAKLRESIRLALTLTDNLFVLTNVRGAGQVHPAWFVREVLRWRAKKIQQIYTEVLRELNVISIDITDICVDPKNLAQDGLHPNGRAHKAIFDRFKHLL